MTRPQEAERLPTPEEIREDDEIDVSPNEYYVRRAAEASARAANASTTTRNQRNAEYKLVVGLFALYGFSELCEKALERGL